MGGICKSKWKLRFLLDSFYSSKNESTKKLFLLSVEYKIRLQTLCLVMSHKEHKDILISFFAIKDLAVDLILSKNFQQWVVKRFKTKE